ncbi:hypothetical protein GSI_04371 [Ganoderma sinense ZZ0214-1]|uniref:Uncharacterized protein n=1 Tax=Ganoderma sinense ZZ0214-1 TaxID=1077348 RepID=A0A2G8SJ00_9APHY|nr:hypothetical protein GSI_04371 [Ganoderma sinense ZZ0214-1]
MAAQEVLNLSSMPRSPSKPFVPLLGLRDLHLVMHPDQLSALLRHIETSPDNLTHFSIALDDSKSDPDPQMSSPRAIAPGTSLFSSPLRQTLPALSTFNSLTMAFSCCVLPFMRGGAEARWGSLSTSATILFHRPDYVEGGGSPFTGNLQHSFDNLVNSILEQGPLSEVRTLVVQCSRTTVPTAAQVSHILRCVPRIRTLVLDVDRSDTHKLIEHLVQARNTSSVPAAPDLQLVVFDLRMLEKDRLRGGLPEALKPLAVRKVAFVGLDLEMRNSWPPDGKIVDSFKAQGLEITWGAAQRSDTWKKILAFGN